MCRHNIYTRAGFHIWQPCVRENRGLVSCTKKHCQFRFPWLYGRFPSGHTSLCFLALWFHEGETNGGRRRNDNKCPFPEVKTFSLTVLHWRKERREGKVWRALLSQMGRLKGRPPPTNEEWDPLTSKRLFADAKLEDALRRAKKIGACHAIFWQKNKGFDCFCIECDTEWGPEVLSTWRKGRKSLNRVAKTAWAGNARNDVSFVV